MRTIHLVNEQATLKLGNSLSYHIAELSVLYLKGDLGAGKTTLVRGLLSGLGYTGFVKSPTFTVVEPYTQLKKPVYHFDLYRLHDPEELDYLGFRDYLSHDNLCIFEWPDHAKGVVPPADLEISLGFEREGRTAQLSAHTASGKYVLEQLEKHL
jgi:tRNA threonylcarbamoyladenosine biosynthesis protein TsaE